KKRQRRSHNAVSRIKLQYCPQCGTAVPSHVVCPNCGHYHGRTMTMLEDAEA
ncbi:MAG: 50S ribosomal protein L32, partial [Planctomycetaceae bacterium]|nr:50S ribosomal protein L32 [Planctomycetaceae bacterium]